MDSMPGACPICGCELSVEAVLYRCWCCNRSFSYTQMILLLRQTSDQKEEVRSDDELLKQGDAKCTIPGLVNV